MSLEGLAEPRPRGAMARTRSTLTMPTTTASAPSPSGTRRGSVSAGEHDRPDKDCRQDQASAAASGTGTSPRSSATPVHLCRILRVAYGRSQKAIISPWGGGYVVLASRNLLYVLIAPEPGRVIPGWLRSPTCAGPLWPAGAWRSYRRRLPASLVIGTKQNLREETSGCLMPDH